MWYYNGGWGWGGWFAMAVFMLLLLGLLIAGVAALIHYSGRPHHAGPPSGASHSSGDRGWGPNRAEDLLAERFARGEIDEDEYRRRLAALRDRS